MEINGVLHFNFKTSYNMVKVLVLVNFQPYKGNTFSYLMTLFLTVIDFCSINTIVKSELIHYSPMCTWIWCSQLVYGVVSCCMQTHCFFDSGQKCVADGVFTVMFKSDKEFPRHSTKLNQR